MSEIAPRYADDSHVLYELFNEPTEPAGGGIGAWRTWKETAEPWVELVPAEAPSAPTVDGSVDDIWQRGDPNDIGVLAWGDEADLSAEWRALWDEEALYLLVSVSDADIQDNDAVEVFLDLDHSGDDSYDGENDLQFVMIPGIKQAWQGPNSATSEPVFVRMADTEEGWRVELSVPWADYDMTPLAEMRFGMAIHVADDHHRDDDRDAKYVWHDRTVQVWQTPSKLATVELGE